MNVIVEDTELGKTWSVLKPVPPQWLLLSTCTEFKGDGETSAASQVGELPKAMDLATVDN